VIRRLLNTFLGSPAADVSIFHEFKRPPYGGGNQFLLALRGELHRRGLRIVENNVPAGTPACLFNSFNFDFLTLRRSRRLECRMVHRVDGPIGVYRGQDDGTDARILGINQELADATIFQSRYSLEEHRRLGLLFKEPAIILNAVDPTIFHPASTHDATTGRKIRLISSSWSDNPRKGAATYKWLDQNLDWSRYDYTFVGRVSSEFDNIRVVAPQPSEGVAELLRSHDIYITASLHDPCSNALIEALACGLPAVYAHSGGHPEIVGEAGYGFDAAEEIPALLESVIDEYASLRARISIPSLAEVADRYLAVLGLASR
jgi:glycosyltransferase involved in cell wall biosynthesis